MTAPLIRMATERDIETLIPLYRAFHEFHVAGMPERLRVPEHYDIPLFQTTISDFIQRPDVALFVAEQEEDLIGFVEVHIRETPLDNAVVHYRYGHVQSLMVAAQYRNAGLGSTLFRAAKEWAISQSIFQLRLDIWEFDAGPLHFYERLGFHTVKREMTIDISDMK